MECIKFTISGQTAFFKKPDVNDGLYFTYNNIHKVALLGMLGAIIGLKGYNQSNNKFVPFNFNENKKAKKDIAVKELPEFYSKLHDLKIGIVPNVAEGLFAKKIIEFTNTTGMANKDGTLIVKQQWIFNPSWDIYILEGHECYDTIKRYLLNSESEFEPYFGTNDHPVNVSNVEVLSACDIQTNTIDSLFIKENGIKIVTLSADDTGYDSFLVKEINPITLNAEIGYEYKTLLFTNNEVNNISNIYNCSGKNIYFF